MQRAGESIYNERRSKMKHVKQQPNECFVAAVCQVRPELNYEEVRQGFQWCNEWLVEFARKYAPEAVDALPRRDLPLVGARLPEGRGLVLVRLMGEGKVLARHAISFEDGLVLDPRGPGTPMTFEAYLEAHSGWVVESITGSEEH